MSHQHDHNTPNLDAVFSLVLYGPRWEGSHLSCQNEPATQSDYDFLGLAPEVTLQSLRVNLVQPSAKPLKAPTLTLPLPISLLISSATVPPPPSLFTSPPRRSSHSQSTIVPQGLCTCFSLCPESSFLPYVHQILNEIFLLHEAFSDHIFKRAEPSPMLVLSVFLHWCSFLHRSCYILTHL